MGQASAPNLKGKLLPTTHLGPYRDEEALTFAKPYESISPLPRHRIPSFRSLALLGSTIAASQPLMAYYVFPGFQPGFHGEKAPLAISIGLASVWGTLACRYLHDKVIVPRKIRKYLHGGNKVSRFYQWAVEDHLDPERVGIAMESGRASKSPTRKQRIASTLERSVQTFAEHPYLTALGLTSPLWAGPSLHGFEDAYAGLEALIRTNLPTAQTSLAFAARGLSSPLVGTLLGVPVMHSIISSPRVERMRRKCRDMLLPREHSSYVMDSTINEAFSTLENGHVSAALTKLCQYLELVPPLAAKRRDLLFENEKMARAHILPYLEASRSYKYGSDPRITFINLAYATLMGAEDGFSAARRIAFSVTTHPLPDPTRAALLAYIARLELLRESGRFSETAEAIILRLYDQLSASGVATLKRVDRRVFGLSIAEGGPSLDDVFLLKEFPTIEEARIEWKRAWAVSEDIHVSGNLAVPKILRSVPVSDGALNLIISEPGLSLDSVWKMRGAIPEKTMECVLDSLIFLHDHIPHDLSKIGMWNLGERLVEKGSPIMKAHSRKADAFLRSNLRYDPSLSLTVLSGIPWVPCKDATLNNWRLTNTGKLLAMDFEDKGILPSLYDLASLLEKYPAFMPPQKEAYLKYYFDRYFASHPFYASEIAAIDKLAKDSREQRFRRAYDVVHTHRALEFVFLFLDPESPDHSDELNLSRLYWEGRRLCRRLEPELRLLREDQGEYFEKIGQVYEMIEDMIPHPPSRVGVSRKET